MRIRRNAKSFVTAVTHCARCGKNHRAIQFKKFKVAPDSCSHYGKCPVTGEPILNQIIYEDNRDGFSVQSEKAGK